MAGENHYSVLGISEDASSSEIKRRYLHLVKRHHPDQGGDHEKMVRINLAYQVLSDPVTRFRYTNQLHQKDRSKAVQSTPYPTTPQRTSQSEPATSTGRNASVLCFSLAFAVVAVLAVAVFVSAQRMVTPGAAKGLAVTKQPESTPISVAPPQYVPKASPDIQVAGVEVAAPTEQAADLTPIPKTTESSSVATSQNCTTKASRFWRYKRCNEAEVH